MLSRSRNVTVSQQGKNPCVFEDQELTGGDVLPEFRCQTAEFFFTSETPAG